MAKNIGSDIVSCKCRMCKLCKAKTKPKNRYRYFARRRQRRAVKELLKQGKWEEIPEKFSADYDG